MADNIQENKRFCSSISTNLFVTGAVVFLLVVFPIVEIAVGVAYLHECPIAPILPVYLIVLGFFCLLMIGLFAIIQPFPAVGDLWIWSSTVFVSFLFILAWFFYGSYLVYTMYPIYHRISIRPPRSEGSYFTPMLSDYTKDAIHPVSSNSTHFTTPTLDYTKSTSFNNSHFPLTTPDNKPSPSSDQNQTQSWSFNQTTMTPSTTQTLMNLIQTLTKSSNQTYREHLNTPRTGAVTSVILYCNKNLYLFVFWTTTLIYVSAGISCVISSACKKGSVTTSNETNP